MAPHTFTKIHWSNQRSSNLSQGMYIITNTSSLLVYLQIEIWFRTLLVTVCQLSARSPTSLSAHSTPWRVQLANQEASRPPEWCNVFTNTHPLWLSLHIAQRSSTTKVRLLYVSVRPYSPMSRECTCHILHLKKLTCYAHSDCRFGFSCEF